VACSAGRAQCEALEAGLGMGAGDLMDIFRPARDEAVTKLVPSAEADSVLPPCVPGTNVPGFLMPSLRDCDLVSPRVVTSCRRALWPHAVAPRCDLTLLIRGCERCQIPMLLRNVTSCPR
jgi:hypothetical protein